MASILEDYVDRAALAQQLGCSTKTIARYENLPNGLPSLTLGGRKLYRVASVRDWISARETKPNRRRV